MSLLEVIMLKLLLLIALVGGGLWWFARGGRRNSGAGDGSGDASARGADDAARETATGEAMVRCEYCNTHVPQSSAVFAGKRAFCCEEHRASAGY
ncbi:MAG: PP0621 family protein [Burkholderiales bacterium]|jgi:hypothetical protein